MRHGLRTVQGEETAPERRKKHFEVLEAAKELDSVVTAAWRARGELCGVLPLACV